MLTLFSYGGSIHLMPKSDEGGEPQLESPASFESTQGEGPAGAVPIPDEVAQLVDTVSHAVAKLEAEVWLRTLPGNGPALPLMEELVWVIRAGILAADKGDDAWLARHHARKYVERVRSWRTQHYRRDAVVPYSRPQAAELLLRWVSLQLTTAYGEHGETRPETDELPAFSTSIAEFTMRCIFQDPEILVPLREGLPSDAPDKSTAEAASKRVLDLLSNRENEESIETTAKGVIKEVLRSVGYADAKVQSLFDAARKSGAAR